MNRHIKLPTQQVLYLLAFADVLLQYGILMAMAIKKQTNIQVLTLHTTTTTKHTHNSKNTCKISREMQKEMPFELTQETVTFVLSHS